MQLRYNKGPFSGLSRKQAQKSNFWSKPIVKSKIQMNGPKMTIVIDDQYIIETTFYTSYIIFKWNHENLVKLHQYGDNRCETRL